MPENIHTDFSLEVFLESLSVNSPTHEVEKGILDPKFVKDELKTKFALLGNEMYTLRKQLSPKEIDQLARSSIEKIMSLDSFRNQKDLARQLLEKNSRLSPYLSLDIFKEE